MKFKTFSDEEAASEPDTIQQMAIIFLAFNAWCQDQTIQAGALKWKGVAAEGFPQIDRKAVEAKANAVVAPKGKRPRNSGQRKVAKPGGAVEDTLF